MPPSAITCFVARVATPLVALCAALLTACTSAPSTIELAQQTVGKQALLLGEVHDNAAGHSARTALLQQRVEAGWRPAIAMEQFDRERQGELDRALATCADADCVIRAASPGATPRWEWAFYEPVIALALRYRLPVIAANVSRADTVRVMREGYASVFDASFIARHGLDRPLPADLLQGQQQEIEIGHCGKMPAAMLPGMVRAQVARDVWMAHVVRDNMARGVALLAGNGHVRRDLGVPRWLADLPPGTLWSIGFVEQTLPGAFDAEVVVAAHDRGDPCEKFR